MKTKFYFLIFSLLILAGTVSAQLKSYPSDDGPNGSYKSSGKINVTGLQEASLISTVVASGFTTTDNENNALTGTPDGDMDNYLCYLPKIEFNIFIDDVSVTTAQLSILAFDVDWNYYNNPNLDERDAVYLNGHFAGYLTGADNQWSTTVLTINPAWVVPGPAGKNLVQVDVDLNDNGWCVTVDWGQLVINGGTPSTASFRSVTIPKTDYSPCETVAITIEPDATPDLYVRVETNLVDPDGNIVAGISRYLTATAGNEPFTENLALPCNAISGNYKVMSILYDGNTGQQLDIEFVPFSINICTSYITCPANKSVGTDDGECYATVSNLGNPVVSSSCQAQLTVTNDAPVDGIYEKGVTEVTWTVTDDEGNTATCVQTVTVFDDEAPEIGACENTKALVVILNKVTPTVWRGTLPQAKIKNTITDNCDEMGNGINVIFSQTVFTPADWGERDVIVTAKDAAGNTVSCAVPIIVRFPLKSGEVGYDPEIDGPVSTELSLITYPNPTTGKVMLEMFNYENPNITVQVINITGQKVFEQEYQPEGFIEIDLTGNKPGMYLVSVLVDNKRIVEKITLKE